MAGLPEHLSMGSRSMTDPPVRNASAADAPGPARRMAGHLTLPLSLFRVGWIAACLLTILVLVILAFVQPPTIEWFAALAGALAALPLGLLFLKYVRGRLETLGDGAAALPVTPAAETLPEPTCFQESDRFWFTARVHFPHRLKSEPSQMIFQEGSPIRVALVMLLWGAGVVLLVSLPAMWTRGADPGLLLFQLVLGVALTVGCGTIFLRLRMALDRDNRTAIFRWGLLLPLRTEVRSLAAFDTVSICLTPGMHTKSGGRRREYVVRLCNSNNRAEFLDLLQVMSREHAERLTREMTTFLGLNG
jgi:hypothetical protein